MIQIIDRVDHKYDDQETGETFTLAWRHIAMSGESVHRANIIKELFMPPDSKVRPYPVEDDLFGHYIVSGWWGRGTG